LVQRVEIITGKERRRRWSDEDKRRLTVEAFAPGATVAHVARLRDVSESCLYAWRKRLGVAACGVEARSPQLVPVTVDGMLPARMVTAEAPPVLPRHAAVTLPDGTRVEVGAGYPAGALKALLAALRPAR